MKEKLKLIVSLHKDRENLTEQIERLDKLASYPINGDGNREFGMEFKGGSTHVSFYPSNDRERDSVKLFFMEMWKIKLTDIDKQLNELIK